MICVTSILPRHRFTEPGSCVTEFCQNTESGRLEMQAPAGGCMLAGRLAALRCRSGSSSQPPFSIRHSSPVLKTKLVPKEGTRLRQPQLPGPRSLPSLATRSSPARLCRSAAAEPGQTTKNTPACAEGKKSLFAMLMIRRKCGALTLDCPQKT